MLTFSFFLKKKFSIPSFPSVFRQVVATLIKQWLKELPEPLLTHSLFRDFIATASAFVVDLIVILDS